MGTEAGEEVCHGDGIWSHGEGRERRRRRRKSVMEKVNGDGGGRGCAARLAGLGVILGNLP